MDKLPSMLDTRPLMEEQPGSSSPCCSSVGMREESNEREELLSKSGVDGGEEVSEDEGVDRREPRVTTRLSFLPSHQLGRSLERGGFGDGSTKRHAAFPGAAEKRRGGRSVGIACLVLLLLLLPLLEPEAFGKAEVQVG